MIKVSITNTVNGRTFGATFSTQAEADSWIASCKAKNSWGLPQRWVDTTESNPAPEGAPTRTIVTQEEEVVDGVTVPEVTQDQHQLPDDYSITVTDLSQSLEWRNEQVVAKRQAEYAKLDNMLKEALVEKELGDSTKWDDYVVLRAQIKTDNPKE